jgi:hypothetical protein
MGKLERFNDGIRRWFSYKFLEACCGFLYALMNSLGFNGFSIKNFNININKNYDFISMYV